MESRFNKYESNNISSNSNLSTHIANVNQFINRLYSELDLIEKEIESLSVQINSGTYPPMFKIKKECLIKLGKSIEDTYEAYHFNRPALNEYTN